VVLVEWGRIPSKIAVAITGSPKISFHWEKLRFEVRSAPLSHTSSVSESIHSKKRQLDFPLGAGPD
jgi:hypothetical protein